MATQAITPQGVPMFGPDGQVHLVPNDQVEAAQRGGGEIAHQLQAPDKSLRYVRHSQLGDALRNGGIPVAAIQQAPNAGLAPAAGDPRNTKMQELQPIDSVVSGKDVPYHPMPGSFEGHPENIGQYPVATAGRAAEGAVDISRGNVAMGTHKLIQAGTNAVAPMAPILAVGAPVTALRAIGGGVIGSKVAGAVANSSGASPDQKALAEDAGNIAGGGIAATGAIRAFLGSPTRALISKVAGATDGLISDDLLGTISPRALHGLRMLRAANKVANGAADSELASIATKHTDAIGAKEQELNDALSKANALPPEGPTAKTIDVPDLRVQPSQQPPQNLLDRMAASQAAQRGLQGEFQVPPPETSGPTAVMRNVQGQPVSSGQPSPQNIPPAILRAIGQAPSTGRATPNMEIYNEPIQPPAKLKPPTLLEQLRQWDQIRQIHAQLEDQIGKGQDELQQWIEDHNQQAPGAKSKAQKPQALPNQPRVPASDAELEDLLMKSVQAAKAKKAMSAKAGDD